MTQRTPTLLYIDDDGALARLVDRGLTRRGYKVDPCRERRGRPRAHPQREQPRQYRRLHRRRGARPVHAGSRRARDARADHGDPGRAAGGVRHGVAGFQHRRHRAEGRRGRLSGQGRQGRLHPAAACRGRQARCARPSCSARARKPRPRSMPRATATRRSPPNAKCCCARSITASAIRSRSSPRCCICRRAPPRRTRSRPR